MRGPLEALLQRIRQEQREQERAVLVLVQLGAAVPGAAERVAAAVRAGVEEPTSIEIVRAAEGAADSVDRLRDLNTRRDSLLHSHRALVFVCPDGAAARLLRREAPDLTAIFDLTFELVEAVELDPEALAAGLRRVQAERYAGLDLSGLVPHSADVVQVPLDAVFVNRSLQQQQKEEEQGGSAELALLLAEPGAGKSVFLKYAAAHDPQGRALYAPLAAWVARTRERTVALLDFLEDHAGGLLGTAPVRLESHLDRLVLLLDGLDEVPSQAGRRAVIDELLALRARHPKLAIIVAAREHVVDDLLAEQLRRLRVVRFQPLDRRQSRLLVERLLRVRRGLAPDAEMPDDLEDLFSAVTDHPDFARFHDNPLLLTFVTVLAELGRGMPTQRAELYGELVEMLIVSWQRVRATAAGRRLNKADVLRVVAPLGWQLVERGVGGLTEAELLDFLVTLDRREGDPQRAREAAHHRLEQLREDSALLHAADGLWRFHHATIAEYLAARAALQSPAVLDALVADPYEARRAQVLAFALAIACDLDPRDDVALPLLHALDAKASRPGRYDAKIPRVLVACLEEARSMPAALRQRLAAHVLRIALCRHLHPQRRLEAMAAVERLCALGDPPVQAAIRDLVQHPEALDAEGIAEARWLLTDETYWQFLWSLEPITRPVPWVLAQGGVDATPLVAQWIASPRPEIRALAWDAWATGDAWQRVVAAVDPDASALAPHPFGWEGPRPATWTDAILRRFPALAAHLDP